MAAIPGRPAPLIATLLLMIVLPCQLARGVEFVVQVNNGDAPHSADPGQLLLGSIVTEAASRWTELIKDPHVMQLDVRYGDIGQICPDVQQSAVSCARVEDLTAGRVTHATVYFSDTTSWYYDATPAVDEEFALTTTLFRDLIPPTFPIGTQFVHFRGFAFEPVLEVGYLGPTTVPSLNQTDDLLTAALREIGFLLGMSPQIPASVEQYRVDGDFDFPQSMLGGIGMAVTAVTSSESVALLNSLPLLSHHSPTPGTRRLPSATDVLALAGVGWEFIEFDRNYLLSRSNGDFHLEVV